MLFGSKLSKETVLVPQLTSTDTRSLALHPNFLRSHPWTEKHLPHLLSEDQGNSGPRARESLFPVYSLANSRERKGHVLIFFPYWCLSPFLQHTPFHNHFHKSSESLHSAHRSLFLTSTLLRWSNSRSTIKASRSRTFSPRSSRSWICWCARTTLLCARWVECVCCLIFAVEDWQNI